MLEAASTMSEELPSTSASSHDVAAEPQAPFITHKVTRLDTLAGLAVRYNVSVSDIKRSNGLLSDIAMYAKDRLFIPTQAMPPIGVEYSTWAGMIVTQYGRIPGSMLANGVHFNGQPSASGGGQQGGSPQRQSAALDELQRYYGTGDTASEPEDFRPGSPVHSAPTSERLARLQQLVALSGNGLAVEIEMTEFEAGGPPEERGPQLPEYAGARDGPAGDERLRRRKASDGLPDGEAGARLGGDLHDSGSLPARPPVAPRVSPSAPMAAPAPGRERRSSLGRAAGGPPGRRRDTLLERIRRAASAESLAGLKGSLPAALSVPGMLRAAEALVSRSDSGHASSLGSRPSAEAAAAPDAPLPAGAPSQQQGRTGLPRVPSSPSSLSALLQPPPKKKD